MIIDVAKAGLRGLRPSRYKCPPFPMSNTQVIRWGWLFGVLFSTTHAHTDVSHNFRQHKWEKAVACYLLPVEEVLNIVMVKVGVGVVVEVASNHDMYTTMVD